jgi:non-specific serine/threonine protein kinase
MDGGGGVQAAFGVKRRFPVSARPLIGRSEEIAAVRQLLSAEGVRLLTLVGPGGVGKTRLAIAVAESLADTAVFVDLSPLRDPSLVLPTVADVLGVRDGSSPTQRLLQDALQEAELLLVLDNFEQVIAAAPHIGELIGSCPKLQVLATSRAALNLSWERLFPVPPLKLPEVGRPLESIVQAPAVALFVEQARAVRPDFALTSANAAAAAQLVRKLDGLPLAIELAAARTRMLPPDTILSQLQQRPLRVLTGGARDAPERHRTLREAIDWSYNLLSPEEQVVFRRLGVFAGGCSIEAAEAVAAEPAILEVLDSLVDKHLLLADDAAGLPRLRMLDTIREYALERLAESGEEAATRERHAACFAALAGQAGPAVLGRDQRARLEQLGREHDNIREALRWSLSGGSIQVELGARLAAAFWWSWFLLGQPAEGRRWLEALLEQPQLRAPSVERGRLLVGLGAMAYLQGDTAAEDRAAAELSPILDLDFDDDELRGRALFGMSAVALRRGEHAAARAYAMAGINAATRAGDRFYETMLFDLLGVATAAGGDLSTARALLEDNLERRRRLENPYSVAEGLGRVGQVAFLQGEMDTARARWADSLAIYRDTGERWGTARCLEAFAALAAERGDAVRAARIAGAAEAVREALGRLTHADESGIYAARVSAARAAVDSAAWEAAWQEGRSLDLDAAAALALDQQTSAPRVAPSSGPLSPREMEVARLIAQGKTSKEIADLLVITERTADTHAGHIRDKLGLRSRAEIAAWATREGL